MRGIIELNHGPLPDDLQDYDGISNSRPIQQNTLSSSLSSQNASSGQHPSLSSLSSPLSLLSSSSESHVPPLSPRKIQQLQQQQQQQQQQQLYRRNLSTQNIGFQYDNNNNNNHNNNNSNTFIRRDRSNSSSGDGIFDISNIKSSLTSSYQLDDLEALQLEKRNLHAQLKIYERYLYQSFLFFFITSHHQHHHLHIFIIVIEILVDCMEGQ